MSCRWTYGSSYNLAPSLQIDKKASIHHSVNCITITYFFVLHMSNDLLSWDMQWPILPFLTSAATCTPTLTNSIIALKHKNHYPGKTIIQYCGLVWLVPSTDLLFSLLDCCIHQEDDTVINLSLLISWHPIECYIHNNLHHATHFQMVMVSWVCT